MKKFSIGDVVRFDGDICRVVALRGRSQEHLVGSDGFIEVVTPRIGSHRPVGCSLFAEASKCESLPNDTVSLR